MVVLAQIGDRLDVSGASAPPMKFVNRKTGADVGWTFIDQNTGEHVNAMDLAIEAGPGADDLVRWRLSHAEGRTKISKQKLNKRNLARSGKS
jgi:hypothetical protein